MTQATDNDNLAACAATADGLNQETYALLAQANLCRIRGGWQDAIEKCMSAMRMDPQCVAAHSLLGDIYENKGCLDDAVQWYRMALDINPSSPADQQKLDRLLLQKSRLLERVKPPPPAVVRDQEPSAQDRRPDWARDPSRALRFAAFSSASLVLAIVMIAMLVSREHAGGVQARIATPPVVLATNNSPSDDDHGSLSDVRETADLRLLSGLRQDLDLSSHGVSVTDAQSDPRDGRAILTVLIAAKDSVSLNRDAVSRTALRAAHSAMHLTDPSSYTEFTVRVLTSGSAATPGASGAALCAIVDINRANQAILDGDIAQMTTPQIQQVLTRTWWSGSVLD